MKPAIDKWTLRMSCALVLGALLACKHKTDDSAVAAQASASAAAAQLAASAAAAQQAAAATQAAAAAAAAVPAAATVDAGIAAPTGALGDVKRFPDKEKAATGAVKVTIDQSNVYNEPDDKTPSVASLAKDLFVFRLATLAPDWVLVDFPSGVGKVSPGWIEAKSIGAQVQTTVTHATVASQAKTATLASSAKPATSAAAPATGASAAKPATATSATKAVAATPAPAAVTSAAAAPPAAKKKPSMLVPPKHP